jgi:hypothetical protein
LLIYAGQQGHVMSEDPISVIDVAIHHGQRKQTIFKIIKHLGIESRKIRGTKHGQFLSHITQDEFRLVSNELLSCGTRYL